MFFAHLSRPERKSEATKMELQMDLPLYCLISYICHGWFFLEYHNGTRKQWWQFWARKIVRWNDFRPILVACGSAFVLFSLCLACIKSLRLQTLIDGQRPFGQRTQKNKRFSSNTRHTCHVINWNQLFAFRKHEENRSLISLSGVVCRKLLLSASMAFVTLAFTLTLIWLCLCL